MGTFLGAASLRHLCGAFASEPASDYEHHGEHYKELKFAICVRCLPKACKPCRIQRLAEWAARERAARQPAKAGSGKASLGQDDACRGA